MEYQNMNSEANRSIINKVESGPPRWLIEIGFVF